VRTPEGRRLEGTRRGDKDYRKWILKMQGMKIHTDVDAVQCGALLNTQQIFGLCKRRGLSDCVSISSSRRHPLHGVYIAKESSFLL
jgi:hypothetical protein